VKYSQSLPRAVQIWLSRIKLPFGTWTQMGPRNHVLDAVQINGQFRGGRSPARTCPAVNILKATQLRLHLFDGLVFQDSMGTETVQVTPQLISMGFASWQRYCTALQ